MGLMGVLLYLSFSVFFKLRIVNFAGRLESFSFRDRYIRTKEYWGIVPPFFLLTDYDMTMNCKDASVAHRVLCSKGATNFVVYCNHRLAY
jgi:hypothetical protein